MPASPSPAPRAMKRELAFALQSLSAIKASPGRTRSGRSLTSSAPAPAPKRRRRPPDHALDKDKDKDLLVSPHTPPMDAEAPKPPIHLLTDGEGDHVGSHPHHHAGSHESQPAPDLIAAVTTVAAPAEPPKLNALAAASHAQQPTEPYAATAATAPAVPMDLDAAAAAVPAEPTILNAAAATTPAESSEVNTAAETVKPMALNGEPAQTANPDSAMELQQPPALPAADADKPMDVPHESNGPNLQHQVLDNALTDPSLLAESAATPSSTADIKPMRRFTRSLLKTKPEGEEATPSKSQGPSLSLASDDNNDNASVNLYVPPEVPQRRFTRSLLKVKVVPRSTTSLPQSKEAIESTSDSSRSVKKMEMKMSKKVACLTKHPSNIRELLNTGLLEGMPVMYVIPSSKKAVLKGVITGCNIRCFCSSCNGSKQHAGSNKKHPADHIYLENGNSLRDVLRSCESSPLESLDKTIRSSIDPIAKRSYVNCLNCNEHLPSSQTQSFLCQRCLEPKQHQDPPSPSYACKSNSSLVPSPKEFLVKKTPLNTKCGSAGKVTTKDTGLHKLVFKVLLDGTEVAYYVDGQRKVDGYIKDQRIYCNHCNTVVSPSAFEAHAGEGTRRKPYDNIFTSNGVSLHELSMKISKDMELSERETDDLCRECGQGGDIFPCKMCPRSFHPACVGLSAVPSEWYCDNCTNLVQKEKALAENKNAKAAGRQAGVDSIEQIMKRAIRIVPISDDLGGCALCKQKDFNNSVFDERTVILCDQCEKEYHVGCLRSQCQVDLKELPEGEWFCCNSCSEIRSSLDKIIADGALLLPESDIDIIRKKHETKGISMDSNVDIRWRLLAGRSASEDGDLLLSAAVPIIHQSFDPIIEVQSGRDLIPEMVNGRRPKDGMPGQDYSGMYCAVLTLGTSVVSAALLRVMGGEVAELPLVATSKDLQGLGYFQALFSCIERMLISLKIKHFMLPAAHEAEGIWMKKFGFSKIPQEQSEAYLNGAHLTIFHGTSNLYKAIPSS
uniref:PHD-type domain-containing protein n=1 Tax=Leersia perrieri TaxID=77586 RepID=A0A0D9WKQ2_9ORYZ